MKNIIFILTLAVVAGCATQDQGLMTIPEHECKYIIPNPDLLPKCGDCESEKVCLICERWENRVLGPQFYQYTTPGESEIHLRQISESNNPKNKN